LFGCWNYSSQKTPAGVPATDRKWRTPFRWATTMPTWPFTTSKIRNPFAPPDIRGKPKVSPSCKNVDYARGVLYAHHSLSGGESLEFADAPLVQIALKMRESRRRFGGARDYLVGRPSAQVRG
jgi:hypothetical protein